MKLNYFKTVGFVSFLLFLSEINCHAQKKINALEVGLGSSYYFGDLSPYEDMAVGFITTPSFNFHFGYTQYIDERSEIIYDLTFARIVGDDFSFAKHNIQAYKEQFIRNLHFRNDIKELSARWRYHFKPTNMREHMDRPKFNAYATLGFGIIGHNPEAKLPAGFSGSNWVYLRDKNTSGQHLLQDKYSLVQIVIPFGIGMRYKLSKYIDLNLESVLRISGTDYLDDVANTKYNPANLFDTAESYALHNRSTEVNAIYSGQSRNSYIKELYGQNANINTITAKELGTQRGFNKLFRKNDGYCLVNLSLIYWLEKR